MKVIPAPFGNVSEGSASLYTVRNAAGMEVAVSDFGARMVSVKVPCEGAEPLDVVLGYDDAAGYEADDALLGAPVGRVVNRIGGASFQLEGKTYELTANEGANCNHSGRDFWCKRFWAVARAEQGADGGLVELVLDSPDGDQGFPGAVQMHLTFEVTAANELVITYDGTPDAPTLVNVTNHSYWNLNGCDGRTVLGHRLTVDADSYTETDDALVSTGRILPIDGTPLDLHDGKKLADVVASPAHSIVNARGIDHNFVLPEAEAGEGSFIGVGRRVAELVGDESKIRMTVTTDMPGMQVYTGNYLDGVRGKGGVDYHDHDAVALETNFFADAIHHPNFPQPVFGPDRPFRSRTVYAFA